MVNSLAQQIQARATQAWWHGFGQLYHAKIKAAVLLPSLKDGDHRG